MEVDNVEETIREERMCGLSAARDGREDKKKSEWGGN